MEIPLGFQINSFAYNTVTIIVYQDLYLSVFNIMYALPIHAGLPDQRFAIEHHLLYAGHNQVISSVYCQEKYT